MHQILDETLGINLLHANQEGADHNRAHFDEWGITCLNVMSSPGAGKTVLLEKTLAALTDSLKIAVIEGDMTTELDAERLRQYNVPVIAINTGRACHLAARMVAGGIHPLKTPFRAGCDRNAGGCRGVARRHLVSHGRDGFGIRADEDEAGVFHRLLCGR